MSEEMHDMAYEPLSGWIQVTKSEVTGDLHSLRFHSDHTCAQRSVPKALQRGLDRDRPVESYLQDKMQYATARRYARLTLCKCSGGQRRHATGPDRRFGEVQAGSQGTGRRR